MKKLINNSINRFGLLVILAAFFTGTGCSMLMHHSDPLVGWKLCQSQDPKYLDKAIRDDYQDYIQKLSSKEREFATYDNDFEDGTGQHAVKITIGLNGTDWEHILIYDKNDKRIKTIKYVSGNSSS